MALSSILLASGSKSVDTELDALFKPSTAIPASPKKLKRKHDTVSNSASKRPKVKETPAKPVLTSQSDKSKKRAPSSAHTEKKKAGTFSKVVPKEDEDMEDASEQESEDENDSELENAYLSRALKGKGKAPAADPEDASSEEEQVEDDVEDVVEDAESDTDWHADDKPLQHESVSKKRTKTPKPKSKYVPPDETPEQRNARTIFIGNLSVQVTQKKSLLKQLQRHVLSLIPSPADSPNVKPKIESTRFRSVPFAVPTSKLDDEDESTSTGKSPAKLKKSRQHDLDRTTSWKSKAGDGETAKDEKKFLTPAQKKKIAFINQEFHASGDSVNAYIVFAHPVPATDDSAAKTKKVNVPPPPETMDPYEAARVAMEACNGSEFMERMLRVDIVAKGTVAGDSEAQGRVIRSDVDPKRCIFVGNLDFESKEEDVRVFFEGVVSAEKGPRVVAEGERDEEDDSSDDQAEKHSSKRSEWVTRVRIIRDKDTLLGKGFAYVQFAARECVDEIVAMESGKLKFAKRKLRVERCKTLPGGSLKTKAKSSGPNRNKSTKDSHPNRTNRPVHVPPSAVPKGDPSLGAKLAHLSKDERKQAKAGDADRLARRLAKKKARMSLAVGDKGSDGIKVHGKERSRERKPRSGAFSGKGKGHGVGSAAKNKGKAKSDRSVEKRNAKK